MGLQPNKCCWFQNSWSPNLANLVILKLDYRVLQLPVLKNWSYQTGKLVIIIFKIWFFFFCFNSAVVFNYIDTYKDSKLPQMYILSSKYRGFHLFFSLPAAGLSNQPLVKDSNPGALLIGGSCDSCHDSVSHTQIGRAAYKSSVVITKPPTSVF